MAVLEPSLRRLCEARPSQLFDVIVTMRDPNAPMPHIQGLAPIAGLPGIYKAHASGEELLRLESENIIAEIAPDSAVHILGD